MRRNRLIGLVAMAGMAWFSSCSTVEKASIHDFASGYYHLDSGKTTKKV